MKIAIDLERTQTLAVAREACLALLGDIPALLALFPKLRKLHPLGGEGFLIDLRPIGSRAANIEHSVAFAATFAFDAARGELGWTPRAGQGNATLTGLLTCAAAGASTQIRLKVSGELNDVPVPLLYRPVAPAFIRGKFAAMLDIFLERIGEAAATPRAGAAKPARSERSRTKAA